MDLTETMQSAYSVSQLTREIKELLETTLPPLWLRGEISNFVHHSSGHMYFSLKDEGAQIACVIWRSRNISLFFTPVDGMQVLAVGQVRVYEKRGAYQFDISRLMPAGQGPLQLAFDKLKERLFREGLFDESAKKAIPAYPESIGLITSPTGAALQDLLQIIRRRAPHIRLVLRPTLVQGEGAAEDIVQAIRDFNQFGGVDVLILGRGGGSLEDLWAFNEEIVARAIHASRLPVISAVGHEIDFTISDFVADLRAPTPSAAAELVTPEYEDLRAGLSGLASRCRAGISRRLEQNRQQVRTLQRSYGLRRPADLIVQKYQRLDELQRLLQISFEHTMQRNRLRLQHVHRRLDDLSPESILRRGYSLCWRQDNQKLVTRTEDVVCGSRVEIQLATGRLESEVQKIVAGKKWNQQDPGEYEHGKNHGQTNL